jgi:hypothetical protein
MKTIEERAQEYAHQYRRDAHDLKGERADAAFAAYCQGAEDEHKELTRWHDPNITPDDNKPVIICTSPGIYYIAAYDKQFNYWFTGNGSFYRHEILGWREIHE